jgi:hypothetical protein
LVLRKPREEGIMKELMTALLEANVKPESAEKALTSIEKAIHLGVEVAKMEFTVQKIAPVEKDQFGIRSEIQILADTMRTGFDKTHLEMNYRFERMQEEMNSRFERMQGEMNLRFEKIQEEMNLRFEKMDQKMDFIRENLEVQIQTTKENLEKQIGFQQKLLWIILTVVLGSLMKLFFP